MSVTAPEQTAPATSETPAAMPSLRLVTRHVSAYAAGIFAGRVLGLVMIPVYTRLLQPADYGVLEVLSRMVEVLGLLLGLSASAGLLRFFHQEQEKERRAVVSTAALLTGASALVGLALAAVLAPTLSQTALRSRDFTGLLLLFCAACAADVMLLVPLARLRAENRSRQYMAVTLARLAVALSLNIAFVVALRQGVRGIAYSSVITSWATMLVMVALTFRRYRPTFSAAWAKALLHYSLPLVPANLAMFVLNSGDRFLLARWRGAAEVGIYGLGYSFGMLLSIVVLQTFYLFWGAHLFRLAPQPGARVVYARVTTQFLTVATLAGAALAIFAPALIGVMTGTAFHDAAHVVPAVTLAYWFFGAYQMAQTGLLLERHTGTLARLGAICAGANLLLNWLLIPRFGMMGAAAATTLSFALLALTTLWAAQRVYRIPFAYAPLLGGLALAVAVWGAMQLLPAELGSVSRLGIKLVALLALSLALVPLGLWRDEPARRRALAQALRFPLRACCDTVRRLVQARAGSGT